MTIHLCSRPGSVDERTALSLRDLAPGGVCRAIPVTGNAGALLPHRFTLTGETSPPAVCSLWHFPASHLDWREPAPCPAEPRLSSAPKDRGHPVGSPPPALVCHAPWRPRRALDEVSSTRRLAGRATRRYRLRPRRWWRPAARRISVRSAKGRHPARGAQCRRSPARRQRR